MRLIYLIALSGLNITTWETVKFCIRRYFGKTYLDVNDESWPSLIQREYGALVDVGSNFGQFAGSFLSLNGQVELIAFDPHIECGQFMTLRYNQFVFHNVALGSVEGEFNLYYPRIFNFSFLSLASLQKENVTEWIEKNMPVPLRLLTRIYHKRVHVKRLDDLKLGFKSLNRQKILFKIDVQGTELQVLRGSIDFIKQYNPDIFIEMEFKTKVEVGVYLNEIGYRKSWQKGGDELWRSVKAQGGIVQ